MSVSKISLIFKQINFKQKKRLSHSKNSQSMIQSTKNGLCLQDNKRPTSTHKISGSISLRKASVSTGDFLPMGPMFQTSQEIKNKVNGTWLLYQTLKNLMIKAKQVSKSYLIQNLHPMSIIIVALGIGSPKFQLLTKHLEWQRSSQKNTRIKIFT